MLACINLASISGYYLEEFKRTQNCGVMANVLDAIVSRKHIQ